MAEYPPDLASRPAAEAAALVCQLHLDAAHAAAQRLVDPSDTEALHDFRVAVRRLRSTLRSFRSELDHAIPRKLRNRLRDLTRATTAGRDAEVLIAAVKMLEEKLERSQRAGVPWLLARLAERRDRAYEQIQDELASEFPRLERRLRKALRAAGQIPEDSGDVPTFGAVAARLLTEQAALLAEEIATLRSAGDEPTAHGIRIVAKHLRYLLEPLAEAHPGAAALLSRLKAIQTQLGDLHDLQVLGAELVDAVGDAGAERARRQHDLTISQAPRRATVSRKRPHAATTGVLALARLAQQAQHDAFGAFGEERQRESQPDLQAGVASLAAALARPATPPPAPPQDPGSNPA